MENYFKQIHQIFNPRTRAEIKNGKELKEEPKEEEQKTHNIPTQNQSSMQMRFVKIPDIFLDDINFLTQRTQKEELVEDLIIENALGGSSNSSAGRRASESEDADIAQSSAQTGTKTESDSTEPSGIVENPTTSEAPSSSNQAPNLFSNPNPPEPIDIPEPREKPDGNPDNSNHIGGTKNDVYNHYDESGKEDGYSVYKYERLSWDTNTNTKKGGNLLGHDDVYKDGDTTIRHHFDAHNNYTGTEKSTSDGENVIRTYYDENGRVTSVSTEYYDDITNTATNTVYYDENNNVIKTEMYIYDSDGDESARIETSKGENGVTTTNTYEGGELTSTLVTDKNGNVLSETVCKYDENNNLTTSLTSIYENGYLSSTIIVDKKGNLLSETIYNKDGSVASKTEYKYDENGNMLSKTIYNENGSIESRTEYKYDEDGNPINSTERNDSNGDANISDEDADELEDRENEIENEREDAELANLNNNGTNSSNGNEPSGGDDNYENMLDEVIVTPDNGIIWYDDAGNAYEGTHKEYEEWKAENESPHEDIGPVVPDWEKEDDDRWYNGDNGDNGGNVSDGSEGSNDSGEFGSNGYWGNEYGWDPTSNDPDFYGNEWNGYSSGPEGADEQEDTFTEVTDDDITFTESEIDQFAEQMEPPDVPSDTQDDPTDGGDYNPLDGIDEGHYDNPYDDDFDYWNASWEDILDEWDRESAWDDLLEDLGYT